jgi:nucleoside-diphosphate-sugar epimerase
MYADSSRARKTLGWEPRVFLEEGLKRTVAWFREYYREELSA